MSKASTLTDIANLALSTLGEKNITNIDSDGKTENLIRPLLYESIRQTQQEILWQELRVTYTANESALKPSGDYTPYEYNLPTNFLDMVDIAGGADWELENGKLLTPNPKPTITYKRYSEEVTEWSGYLVEMVYKRLCANSAMAITQNVQLQQQMAQMYELAKVNNLSKTSNRRRKIYERTQDYAWQRARRVRY